MMLHARYADTSLSIRRHSKYYSSEPITRPQREIALCGL